MILPVVVVDSGEGTVGGYGRGGRGEDGGVGEGEAVGEGVVERQSQAGDLTYDW